MRIASVIEASQQFAVPASMLARLDAAVERGRAEADAWAKATSDASTGRFHHDALGSIEPPATGDAMQAELDEVRSAQRGRTEHGDARANHLARRAAWDEWEAAIERIGTEQGPEQARRAARLVALAAGRTDEVVAAAKSMLGRPRPYQVDDSITTVVPRPHGNASHPSGHASGAYAAATVLAALDSGRAAEYLSLAAEVAWSRVYGGVHFSSDVIVGARIAARVAADVLRRDAAGLPDR